MKIDLDDNNDLYNRVSSYSAKEIVINKTPFINSFILFPDKILPDWHVSQVSDLSIKDFEIILEFNPEIILFGSGNTMIFPDPRIIASIQNHNIGFEVMDTMAACRSYNVLLNEERRVAAALIINN